MILSATLFYFEPPRRQGRQEKRSLEISIPGVPGVLAVNFLKKLGSA
jgi:hypothetical protein